MCHWRLIILMSENFLFLHPALSHPRPLEPCAGLFRCGVFTLLGRQLVQRGRRSLTVPHKAWVYWQGSSHLTQQLAGVYWKIKELISNYRRIFQSLPQLRDKLPCAETNPGAVCEASRPRQHVTDSYWAADLFNLLIRLFQAVDRLHHSGA